MICVSFSLFFFFKQKTAYEMRISDWSSDVCSSDLQPEERALLRPGQILYTYLHLAPDPDQTRDLMASGAVCIAYETVTDAHGGLPLLKPMSQVAGRMAIQAGATALEKANGGRGVLLGGGPGRLPAQVAVTGGGVVRFNAGQEDGTGAGGGR